MSDDTNPYDYSFDGPADSGDVDSDPALATVDLTNAGQIKKIRDRQRREQEQGAAFWRAILYDPIGRREVWNLLQSAHAFEERFACSPTGFPDPNATFFHAGEQAFGMRLFLSLLKMSPDGVQQMLDEHHSHFQKPKRAERRSAS